MTVWRVRGAWVLRGTVMACVMALAMAVQACGPAAASTKATSTYFGMHAPDLGTAFPSVPAGAVNLTTNAVYWPQLETSRGHYDFTHLNAVVQQARAHGAKPLLVLGQTPRFASTKPHAANVLATVPKMAPWRAYVARVAARYGSTIDYEIWPEPNISQNWAGSPQQLASLVVAASKIIHQKARHAVVVGPGMVLRMKYQRTFFDHFYAAKVGGVRVGHYVNAVGIDAYPLQNGTPEDSAALIRTAHKILASHRVKAPLWNVEIT
jgi:polysaccharide biosynthesis protein PslG